MFWCFIHCIAVGLSDHIHNPKERRYLFQAISSGIENTYSHTYVQQTNNYRIQCRVKNALTSITTYKTYTCRSSWTLCLLCALHAAILYVVELAIEKAFLSLLMNIQFSWRSNWHYSVKFLHSKNFFWIEMRSDVEIEKHRKGKGERKRERDHIPLLCWNGEIDFVTIFCSHTWTNTIKWSTSNEVRCWTLSRE